MFGGLTLTERVDLDYTKARRRARVGVLKRAFGMGGRDLRDFEEVRKKLGGYGTRGVGIKEIEVDRIVGSVGRSRDFDGDFMPRNAGLRHKWMRIARHFHDGGEFQPIRVYEIGDDYYVEDGNHRVSVAKFNGVGMLDAEVIRIVTTALVGLRYATAEKKGTRFV